MVTNKIEAKFSLIINITIILIHKDPCSENEVYRAGATYSDYTCENICNAPQDPRCVGRQPPRTYGCYCDAGYKLEEPGGYCIACP